jgi:hypothetical protein
MDKWHIQSLTRVEIMRRLDEIGAEPLFQALILSLRDQRDIQEKGSKMREYWGMWANKIEDAVTYPGDVT